MPVIGVLYSGNSEAFREDFAAISEGVSESGFVQGRNIAIEFRMADGHLDRLPGLADDLGSKLINSAASRRNRGF
jgi:putative ABC transport system substrate-binding protein